MSDPTRQIIEALKEYDPSSWDEPQNRQQAMEYIRHRLTDTDRDWTGIHTPRHWSQRAKDQIYYAKEAMVRAKELACRGFGRRATYRLVTPEYQQELDAKAQKQQRQEAMFAEIERVMPEAEEGRRGIVVIGIEELHTWLKEKGLL